MTNKSINEAIDPVLAAVAAGIAAYAGHKLYKRYKQKKTLEKIGIEEEPKKENDEEDSTRDIAYYNAVDLPSNITYTTFKDEAKR